LYADTGNCLKGEWIHRFVTVNEIDAQKQGMERILLPGVAPG